MSTLLADIAALPAVLRADAYTVEVLAGPDTGQTLGPFSPPIRVGGALGNDVQLSDPTVSRFHCAFEHDHTGLVLRDCGSRNGSFLGSHRVQEGYVGPTSQVRIGESTLRVTVTGKAPVELSDQSRFGDLRGGTPEMRVLFALLQRLARVQSPVLIEGETGTGKELVARALASESRRSHKPFVVVDGAAIASTLVESELFGHRRGAFTGAHEDRKGAFERAHGGVLFLDELGELSLELQPKLLRVLETGVVRRVGDGEERTVDVRVVAATHRDLRQMVNAGTFREDLYYRLAVCPVRVPPLRERLGDIPILGRLFLARLLGAQDDGPPLSPDTISALQSRPWPGNVRELRNAVERAYILGEPTDVAQGRLAAGLRLNSAHTSSAPAAGGLEDAKRQFERAYLIRLMARHAWVRERAAEEAEVHPKSLARLLRRHEIIRPGK